MPYSKKKNVRTHLPRKKLADINPREYTVMGANPDFIHFDPSNESSMSYPISHKLEKWILIILLAFAMAAFMGFKLLENSDLAFTLTDPSVSNSSNSLSSDQEFKSEFKKNRLEARALMADHQASVKPMPKYGKRAKKFYAKSTKKSLKKIAKSSNKKKLAKSSRKKTLARR